MGTLALLGAGPGSATGGGGGGGTERTALGFNGVSLSSAATYYCPPTGILHASGTTRANAEIVWRGAGTFRNLYARASANTWSAGTTITLYVNGSATALTCTIAASGTAANDTSNSVAVADGDLVCWGVTLAAGSGAIFIRNCTVQFETDGQISTMIGVGNMNAGSASTSVYARMGGAPASTGGSFLASEADASMRALENCTISNIQAYASAATGTTVFTSRKNAGAGSQTFTIDAVERQEDTTNTDSLLVSGPDTFTVNKGATSGGAITVNNVAMKYVGATSGVSMVCSGGNVSNAAAGTTTYASLLGGTTTNTTPTTESNAAGVVPFACTMSMLTIYVVDNASTADMTVTLMKNGAEETALQLVVGAGVEGQFFQDATGSVSFAAGDTVSVRFTGMATGNVVMGWIAALVTDDNAGA